MSAPWAYVIVAAVLGAFIGRGMSMPRLTAASDHLLLRYLLRLVEVAAWVLVLIVTMHYAFRK